MTDGRKKLSEAKLEKKLQTVFFFFFKSGLENVQRE